MSHEPGQGNARRHALVAGGRTGGHVYPGLALAEELEGRGWAVSFVGMHGGLEERAATARGLPFHGLPAGPLVGASIAGKVKSLATVARGAAAGRSLVRREGADLVVGLGGYVSVPAVLGARLAGRPILLFEPNASPGVANRLLSKIASAAGLAHAGAASGLSCPAELTGTPVRPEFFEQPSAELASRGETPCLLVLGGSQGASQLNRIVPAALAGLGEAVETLRVVHQCGPRHQEEAEAAYAEASPRLGDLRIVPYLDEMADAMAEANLILSRAGAITLAEICAVGRASMLVPLSLAGAHQVENARALATAGAAEMLDDGEGSSELERHLASILGDPSRMIEMGDAARSLARPDAVAQLADQAERLVPREGRANG